MTQVTIGLQRIVLGGLDQKEKGGTGCGTLRATDKQPLNSFKNGLAFFLAQLIDLRCIQFLLPGLFFDLVGFSDVAQGFIGKGFWGSRACCNAFCGP